MAIKPITNKQIVSSQTYNRAEQVSTRNSTQRQGNRAASVTPGLDYTKNYAITLKDVDTSIMNHIKQVMKPKVSENNEMFDLTVMYANEERWHAVRKRGVLRDKSGTLILPLCVMRRTSVDINEMSGLDIPHDVQNKFATVTRNSKYSKDNRYDRFSVQTGKKSVTENIVTSMPNYRTLNYEFILWTSMIEQMNGLVESFVEETNKYWGGPNDYKFPCTIDSIGDATEMTVDSERFVKSSFMVITKAYLLPEYMNSTISNKVAATKRQLTPSKVVFGFEGDATSEQVKK